VGEPRRRANRAIRLREDKLPGNSAKIRLLLDLVERQPGRVLDVGCGDLALWEAVDDRPEVVGVDLHVDRERARRLGIEVRELDARALHEHDEYDAVVSTQMLDDVHDWRDVLARMARAARKGGTLFVTCDSGDVARPWRQRLRGVPRGPRLEELDAAARALALNVELLRRYGRHDLKRRQGALDGAGRLRTLEHEETLAADEPAVWGLLYLRATRRGAR